MTLDKASRRANYVLWIMYLWFTLQTGFLLASAYESPEALWSRIFTSVMVLFAWIAFSASTYFTILSLIEDWMERRS